MKHQPKKLFRVAGLAQTKIVTCMVAVSFLGAAVCANAQYLSGTLDPGFYGSPLYVQTINTGFGNSTGGGDASGSELDAVYAQVSGGNLYLFIAGCFQANGNHVNIFIAGGNPGQTNLNVSPSTEATMNGSIFPAGFNATYMIDANDSGGTLYCDGFPLPSGSQASQAYLGPVPLTGGIGSTTLSGITFALNNTLTSTMGTSGQALSGSDVGASVTTGLEIEIPTSAIGYAGGSVNVLIDINGGGDGYLSNQFLPGLAVGSGNLGTTTFNFGPAPTPTNYVTFQLDMSEQVVFGTFTNSDLNPSDPTFGSPTNSVAISGNFNGWGTSDQLTNAPILNPADTRTNLYLGTFPLVANLPYTIECKFRVNSLDGGYESPVSTAGSDRFITISNANQVVPVISYDDLGLGDLVLTNTTVTFSIYCPDQTVGLGGVTFTKGSDTIWVNGAFLGWPTWGYDNLPADQQMIEVGSSDVYTNSLVVPRGSQVIVTYKYSFDGFDNENGQNTNHIRDIRTYATNYTFPQDVWSWTLVPMPYPNPGITSTNIVEPSFGYLAAGTPSGGNIPITWLGRPGVVLENSSSLSGWNINTGTDGTQSANWPDTGIQFFRLMKYSAY
jgi:hypothetical protein